MVSQDVWKNFYCFKITWKINKKMYYFILNLPKMKIWTQIYSTCYNFQSSKMIQKRCYFVDVYFWISLTIFNITKFWLKSQVNVTEVKSFSYIYSKFHIAFCNIENYKWNFEIRFNKIISFSYHFTLVKIVIYRINLFFSILFY